jgi:tetratricopeptide (TPR) repeat protein
MRTTAFAVCALVTLGCAHTYQSGEELETLPKLSAVQAQKTVREMLARRAQVFDYSYKSVRFGADRVEISFQSSKGRETCVYRFERENEIKVISASAGDLPGGPYFTVGADTAEGCTYKAYWKDSRDATSLAHALLSLQHHALDRSKPSTADELTEFKAIAPHYRQKAASPLPEEARRHRVRAEAAFEDKRFEDAVELYAKALEISPWWAEGYFNQALLLAETGNHADAITSMRKYLILVPNSPEARAAQDKIYVWEDRAQAGALQPQAAPAPSK